MAEETAGTMRWYVVHTYSGYEDKAKLALDERIKHSSWQGCFDEVLVPKEQVVDMVKGKRRATAKKFFPGYILVHMILNDHTWHLVKETPKVTGFLGDASKPSPISDEEVARITRQIESGALRPKPKHIFEEGEPVKVIDGPFSNFDGILQEVFPDRHKVKVLVSIFGRATPVELDFSQVEKV